MPPGYDAHYHRIRALMLDPPRLCAHCQREPATELDHDPPLAMHRHIPRSGCCRLIPSCGGCNRSGGVLVSKGLWRPGINVAALEPEPERDGLDAADSRFDVPWLASLRPLPESATWPRLMSVPHRAAVGSLGDEFCAWAEARSGYPMRWWQRLVALRLLEVDAAGRLCWETMVLTLARQLGKSWLLRELCAWRIHQAERFGEPQDVLHTGKDLAICKEVQRPLRVWAKARRHEYRVREVNGQEEIEHLASGSRWMVRAKDAVYGYSVSVGAVDEAWKVRASTVDEGLTPTMAERDQPQLWLISTAHRKATKLVIELRSLALAQLELGSGDLLIEWSARAGAELADETAWRAASPHWTERRRRLVASRLAAVEAGELEDPEEPDPVESFRTQWLNQWPSRASQLSGATELLLPEGVWASRAERLERTSSPVWIALEDDYGFGAALAAASRLEDGRIELDGRLCGDWDSAIAIAEQIAAARPLRGLLCGSNLMDRLPDAVRAQATACGTAQTKAGLALLRDLAVNGGVVHDETTTELDETMALATVKEAPSGLFLIAKGPVHLMRAAAWCLVAAHRPVPQPAVH